MKFQYETSIHNGFYDNPAPNWVFSLKSNPTMFEKYRIVFTVGYKQKHYHFSIYKEKSYKETVTDRINQFPKHHSFEESAEAFAFRVGLQRAPEYRWFRNIRSEMNSAKD